jgi:hypothetical protein
VPASDTSAILAPPEPLDQRPRFVALVLVVAGKRRLGTEGRADAAYGGSSAAISSAFENAQARKAIFEGADRVGSM